MDALWSMYNKLEKLRIDGLKTEHVRIILLAIPTRKMENWYACREGDMQWRPMSEISEFYEDVRVLKGALEDTAQHVPAKPSQAGKKPSKKPKANTAPVHREQEERRPLFEDPPDGLLTDPEIIVTSNVMERRSGRRYPRKLEFSLHSANHDFQCDTHDISMNGLSLTEPLPRWVPKTFRATLSHAGTNVRILCARVTESKLQLVDSESWDVIRKWIVKW